MEIRSGRLSMLRSLIDNGDGTHFVPTNVPGIYGIIDSEYADIVQRFNWYVHKSNARHYLRAEVTAKGVRHRFKMHHLIIGKPVGKLVTDHINRNTFDNRKANLRTVTNRENCLNRKKNFSPLSQNRVPGSIVDVRQ